MVTFTFPPGNGNSIPIQPSGVVYIPSTKESMTPPQSMELVFNEGATVSYRTVLEWRLIEANITINVGNGDAVIVTPGGGDTTTTTTMAPPTTQEAITVQTTTTTKAPTTQAPASTTVAPTTAKNYYFNPTFINTGSSEITFTIMFANNPSGKIPVNGRASFTINTTRPSLPSDIVVQFTDGGTAFDINLPWSESFSIVYVEVGSGKAQIVTDGSQTVVTPPPFPSFKTFYLKTSVSNVGSVNVNFYLNSTDSKTGTVPPGVTATIGRTMQSVTLPSPAEITFFESTKSYNVQLPWTESDSTTKVIKVGNGGAIVVTESGGSSATNTNNSQGSSPNSSSSSTSSNTGAIKNYNIQPIVQNSGTKEVTFKFPPSVGQTLTLPPFQAINSLQANSSSTAQPPDMVLEFTEGSGNDAKVYTATLPWTGFPIMVTVGNGKAMMGSITNTQPKCK